MTYNKRKTPNCFDESLSYIDYFKNIDAYRPPLSIRHFLCYINLIIEMSSKLVLVRIGLKERTFILK